MSIQPGIILLRPLKEDVRRVTTVLGRKAVDQDADDREWHESQRRVREMRKNVGYYAAKKLARTMREK